MQALFPIEPRTVFLVATLMIVLTGGVLGLMHRSLAPDVQPSAVSWRIGTLLQAAGCLLLAVQAFLPPLFVLPVANACILVGSTGYLRAMRQFHGLPDTAWILLPAAIGTLGTYVFVVVPSLGARIVVVSLALVVIESACVWTLMRFARSEPMRSRSVLTGIFAAVAVLMLVRAVYSATVPISESSLLQSARWQLSLAPLIAATLPVVGTTSFLLMCLERIQVRWQDAASTDYLTGLANRRTVALAGERAFHAARRQDRAFAVAILDVDHFKAINDRHGHDVGDLALRHLAQVLDEVRRKGDLPGRLGGEEFCLILDEADAAHAVAAAERCRAQLQARPMALAGKAIPMTVSVGVAVLDAGDRNFEGLLRRADIALYAAKGGGRNRVELAASGILT